MQPFLDWLTHLPLGALYSALALAAALENIVPPIPADTVVALGSFLAARGQGSLWLSFAATLGGNIVGATIMFAVGRRYGAGFVRRRIPGLDAAKHERRLRALHGKYGLAALFFSRFLPGVRAVVPPFAGALRLSPVRSIAAMGLASALWYGAITWLAYRVGNSWEALMESVRSLNLALAIGAATLVALAVGIWLVARRRASAR